MKLLLVKKCIGSQTNFLLWKLFYKPIVREYENSHYGAKDLGCGAQSTKRQLVGLIPTCFTRDNFCKSSLMLRVRLVVVACGIGTKIEINCPMKSIFLPQDHLQSVQTRRPGNAYNVKVIPLLMVHRFKSYTFRQ